jgi:hypothetical protein
MGKRPEGLIRTVEEGEEMLIMFLPLTISIAEVVSSNMTVTQA